MKNGTLFTVKKGAPVYWVDEGKARHIANEDVFNGCFKKNIVNSQNMPIPEGTEVGPGSVLANVGGNIYFVDRYHGGLWVTRFIPNMTVFGDMNFKNGSNIASWGEWQWQGYGIGPQFG